jgi:hypothetical protein
LNKQIINILNLLYSYFFLSYLYCFYFEPLPSSRFLIFLVIHEKPFTPQKLFYYISLIDLFLGLSIFALVILSFLLNKPFWIEKVEGKLYPIIGLSLTPFSFFLFLIIIAIYYQTFELFFAKQAMLG